MNDLVISVLDAFKILEAVDLLNESEARDLIQFAQSKTCDTLCKVLNKTARLEVEGGADADNDGYRTVCVGKAEALFEFADHLQRLREDGKRMKQLTFE